MPTTLTAGSGAKQRIGVRLMLTNFVLVSVALIVLIGAIAWGIQRSIIGNAQSTLKENMVMMSGFVDATNKSANDRVQLMLDAFSQMLPQEVELSADDKGNAQLLMGGEPISNDDPRFSNFIGASGATAVVYVRQGEGFYRAASNFKDTQGTPLVGTVFLRNQSPNFFDKVASGQPGHSVFVLGGKKYIGAYRPIRDAGGQHVATIFAGLLFDEVTHELLETIRRAKIGETGYYYIVNSNQNEAAFGTVVMYPDSATVGKSMLDAKSEDGRDFVREMISQKEGLMSYSWLDKSTNSVRVKLAAFATYEPWGWTFSSSVYEDELTAEARRVLWMLVGLGGVAVVVLTGIWSLIINSQIVRPLNEAVRVSHAMRDGDLTQRASVSRMDEVGQLLSSINETAQGLSGVIDVVRGRAQSVALASAEIAQGNQDLSSRTEAQASALQETASAMEELGSTVSHNAEHAKSADTLTQQVQTVVTEGGSAVREVVQTMQRIDESGKKIGDIIGVIDGIAFQTNILALNAAVEAARAGEHGRGFAVVAGEVRSLAGRSAEAAKEIKRLISTNVEEITQGNVRAARAGETMEQAISEIQKVTTLISDISNASVEQSNGVSQAAQAVNQMDQTTQQNAAMVEQMAAAASSLRQQSDELLQAVNVFRVASGSGGGFASAAPAARSVAVSSSSAPKPAAKISAAASSEKPAAAPKAPSLPAPKKVAAAEPAAPRKGAGSEDDWESF